MFTMYDKIRLVNDLPQYDLKAGSVGYIVDIYTQPSDAFEVEFCDDQGRTIALVSLRLEDIKLNE